MKNNILGGLVIFFVVVTCLLMLDDISSKNQDDFTYKNNEIEQVKESKDLAVVENND